MNNICIKDISQSVFEILNIHIWTHCDTFHYIQTMCVSRVNGKRDRGNASEIQPVCNNRKNWFFKCHSFWQFGINWKFLNVNINMAHETMLNVSLKFMYLLMRLLMLLPAQPLRPLYWSLRRANKKSESISIIVPTQYHFKKYKNCFVLMQLHLMLKIFVCDAWLA